MALQRPTAKSDISQRERDAGARHRDEHAELEATLRDLHRRAHSGHWRELNDVWSGFCLSFDTHMRGEEAELFPTYLRDHPEAEAAIAALIREHEELRAIVESLALEIQLHEVRAESVDRFIAKNRAHADTETRRFHPWMEILGPKEA